LALKAATLASLPPLHGALALIAAHGLARAAAVLAMRLLPYAGQAEGAKWKPSQAGLSAGELGAAVILAAWPLLLLRPDFGGLGLAMGAGLALAPALAARRLIGGHTGDVLGAVEQLFELGFLLGVAALSG
jgi:adenosylcobinamide-GDP ribazoletransferase